MRDMEATTHAQRPPLPPGQSAHPSRPTLDGPIDLAAVADTYAMTCIGNCMEPEIADGATLAFDKLAPCRRGDIVVVWKRPDLIREGEPPAVVKRLAYAIPRFVTFPYVGHPDDSVRLLLVVEMLKPKRTFWLGCDTVIAVHRCLGSIAGLGSGWAGVSNQLIDDVRAGRV